MGPKCYQWKKGEEEEEEKEEEDGDEDFSFLIFDVSGKQSLYSLVF